MDKYFNLSPTRPIKPAGRPKFRTVCCSKIKIIRLFDCCLPSRERHPLIQQSPNLINFMLVDFNSTSD